MLLYSHFNMFQAVLYIIFLGEEHVFLQTASFEIESMHFVCL